MTSGTAILIILAFIFGGGVGTLVTCISDKERKLFYPVVKIAVVVLIMSMIVVEAYDRFTYQSVIARSKIEACNSIPNLSAADIDTVKAIDQITNLSAIAIAKSESGQGTDLTDNLDGLLSSNGLTFMVSLIIALLIALMTHQADKVQKYLEMSQNWFASLDDKIQEKVNSTGKQLSEDFDNRVEEIVKIRKEIKKFSSHQRLFNQLLNPIVQIHNLSTIISIRSFDTSNQDKTTIGGLCSRVSIEIQKTCERIRSVRQMAEPYEEDEIAILTTYLEDAHSELKRAAKKVDMSLINELVKDIELLEVQIYRQLESISCRPLF